MRRLALLLAASIFGTGCIVHDDDDCGFSTVTLEWPTFRLANGSITPSCSDAGVAFIDIFRNNGGGERFNCLDGRALIAGAQSGDLLTVEGVDSSGLILLRDEFQIAVDRCADRLVQVQPSEGLFTLDYRFTPTDLCSGGSFIWFSIYDQITGTVTAVADETGNALRYPCDTLIEFPLPSGPYTLQRVEEVIPSGTTYLPAATNCSPANFSITGGTQSVLQVSMADNVNFCP